MTEAITKFAIVVIIEYLIIFVLSIWYKVRK